MTCATVGCELPSSGKSKYCTTHKREARAAWLAKVKASCEEREQRTLSFADTFRKAYEAAKNAHAGAKPTPMTVVGRSNPLDDASPVEQVWHVAEGACGFGSVTVHPGNSAFALWLTRNGYARKAYGGGVRISTNFNSQSVDRASAAAHAMADVLREVGIKAYADVRLD